MRTDETLQSICSELRQSHGDLHAAARRSGVSLDFVCNWIKDDTEAAQAIEEAQRVGYMGLESAAIQRGVHGVEKAVYYKGEVVGQERQYSDTLLVKMLEARVPAFKKGDAGGNTFNGPTQINLMPRATNFDEWLLMKQSTLKARDAAALPAPEAETAQFVEIDADRPLAGLAGLL